ncbi:unnamed protein product [Ceutorhynchus assimilis]|uniref:Uncharacterized protein n=1 Tax=Ceutorhynchus assimilis TaxID=467358 RepID=A0A9N9MI18_9CUCU|nr:unnamed protein product [Ceutorhynchus assimilis]
MDQHNRSETNPNPQNVHLHMHHVHCNCPGAIYPTYYPAATVGFRAPLPPLVPYHAPPSVARPYVQHYQYTQFNMSPFTFPIGSVTGSSTCVQYGTTTSSPTDLVYGSATTVKEKREEGSGDTDRSTVTADPAPPEGYDAGQVTPLDKELLVAELNSEDFVKFLERRCVTAEQIAYRNRIRPCFRNIQNLCIRTRSEILKPGTTISNIHSQGVPWATKDFIYAFVRLINCWHIMRGYWENRDVFSGCGLGKIEKELSPEFRSCYLIWEKQTKEMASHLSNIFYNLDTNLNASSSGATVYNFIPSQVNLTKSSSEGTLTNHPPFADSSIPTNSSKTTAKGVIQLPTPTETVDQANQTVSDYDYFPDDLALFNPNRVYMKRGNYNYPRKGTKGTSTGPLGIEFLETAQNVQNGKEVWANIQLSDTKKKEAEKTDKELNLSSSAQINVHEWLINSNFGEPKSPNTRQQEQKSYYTDSLFDSPPALDLDGPRSGSVTLLQRCKPTENGRKQRRGMGNSNPYELPGGGITETGQYILECLIKSLKVHVLGVNLEGDLEKILIKIVNEEYVHINEVVRDLKYFTKMWDKVDWRNSGWYAQKVKLLLAEHFYGYDFDHIKGDPKEPVGPLKPDIFSDCDQFI